MTKTCLRLLFLALSAASLAHGCGDSSIECLGTPVACENRELSQCTAGCRSFAGCLGDSVACESLTSRPSVCLQTEGCRYVGSCEGGAGCEALDFGTCANTAGCVQVRRCYGGSVSCAKLEDSQCELYPECRLGEECRGTAKDCSDLSSTASCLDVPGCFSADTEPSVVD